MARFGGTEEGRLSAFSSHRGVFYRSYTDTLLSLNQPGRALQVSERSRARSLLTMVERDLLFAADLPAKMLDERRLNAAVYDRTQHQLAALNPSRDKDRIDNINCSPP
jgi:hypothetical protein